MKFSMRQLFCSAFILVLVLLGCATAFAEQNKSRTDDRITDEVRTKLAGDRDVKGGAIDVTVKNGIVTLRGKVSEPKAKQKAEKIARKVKGVTQVVNELVVEFPQGSHRT